MVGQDRRVCSGHFLGNVVHWSVHLVYPPDGVTIPFLWLPNPLRSTAQYKSTNTPRGLKLWNKIARTLSTNRWKPTRPRSHSSGKKTDDPGNVRGRNFVTCNGAGITCVDTHRNLDRQRSAWVAKEITEAMPKETFHVRMSNLAKREMRLQEDMIVAPGSHIVAWLTTVNNE